MSTPHKLARALQETLGSEGGDAMVDWMNKSDADGVDLRQGMTELRGEMHADIAEVKQELRSAVADIQTEFAKVSAEFSKVDAKFTEVHAKFAEVRSEIAQVRVEARADGALLRQEMRAGFAQIEAILAQRHAEFMKWMLGFWVVSLATIVAALYSFSKGR